MSAHGRRRIAGLILLLLLSAMPGLQAAHDSLSLQLPSGQDLSIQRYRGAGKSLLLWLPSERGFSAAYEEHAHALAQRGYEVWLADLHDAYFVETGRRSLESFPLDDVVALIDAAGSAAENGLFLLSASRGAQLSLIAAREWQKRNPGKAGIKGIFLVHAYLYQERPRVGENASYLPIVTATNLPLYLLDTQYSTRSARLGESAEALGAGGSQVYTRIIKGVQGGFFARDENELSEADLAARRDFAAIIDSAVSSLALVTPPTAAVATAVDTRRFTLRNRYFSVLQPVPRALPAPELSLPDYRGPYYRLGRGRVTLVNFWASWCKPCVEEIPSLHRLRERIADPGFDIVTVNVGESRERIENFLGRVAIDLPLLLDRDSKAAKDWKIYVYPSTYLVDHHGQVRYAYLGALEWDSAENIAIIQSLLTQR